MKNGKGLLAMKNKKKEFELAEGVEVTPKESSLADEELNQPAKMRVTMFYDEELLKAIRVEAAKRGMKYQTLIHQTLYDLYLNPSERPAKQSEVEDLKQRLRGLERIVHEAR